MTKKGIILNNSNLENDYMAFSTLGVNNLGITSFKQVFIHLEYSKKDYFYFEGEKLNAFWYAPPTEKYPKIFISELRVKIYQNK